MAAIENIAVMRLYNGSDLVSVIPNVPGKQNSLRIWSSFELDGFVDSSAINGIITKFGDLKVGLVDEARANPGKHPNIDLALKMPENGKLRVEYVTTTEPNVLEALRNGNATIAQAKEAMSLLDAGKLRTAEKIFDYSGKGQWQSQMHGLDAMNAFFKHGVMKVMGEGFYDKVPLKYTGWTEDQFKAAGVRIIPNAFVRQGAYLGSGTTVMPGGIVNTGAYIAGDGVMVDGGARVATGAQVGKGVKIGGGSGLEGVLEPAGRLPTIVEDNVRIGAMCEVYGIIGKGAVIGSGTVMASGVKIFDDRTEDFVEPLFMQLGDKTIAIPYIPENRIAVSGFSIDHAKLDAAREAHKPYVGSRVIRLLDKEPVEMPKNHVLYLRAN